MNINDQLRLAQLRWPNAHQYETGVRYWPVEDGPSVLFNPRDPEFILWLCVEWDSSLIDELHHANNVDEAIDAVLEVRRKDYR